MEAPRLTTGVPGAGGTSTRISGMNIPLPDGLQPYRAQRLIMVRETACLLKGQAYLEAWRPGEDVALQASAMFEAPTGTGS